MPPFSRDEDKILGMEMENFPQMSGLTLDGQKHQLNINDLWYIKFEGNIQIKLMKIIDLTGLTAQLEDLAEDSTTAFDGRYLIKDISFIENVTEND